MARRQPLGPSGGGGDFREKWFEGFAGEEFEELYRDDAFAHVYAIDHYARSENDPRRMCYIHGLGAGAEQADFVTISLILVPLLRDLFSDDDPAVRENALKQIPRVAECLAKEEGPPDGEEFQGVPDAYAQVLELVLASLPCLEDEAEEVQEAASSVLLEMAAFLEPADLQRHIIEYLSSLALSVHDDDSRTAALELLCAVAEKPFVAVDSILDIVLPALAMLAEDGSFKIRRSVVLGCLQVAEAVLLDADVDEGLELALSAPVVQMFTSLCHDQVWSVRQACAQNFHRVLGLLVRAPDAGDLPALLERFDSMLSDVSEWVRRRAHAGLAEVLVHLDTTVGFEDYFEKWVRKFAEVCSAPSTEEETQEVLATQIAKMVEMLGPDEWDHLRNAFKVMARSSSWRVRAAISTALPTLSAFLDTQAVTDDLLPIAEAFLSDNHLSVRTPLVDGLRDILGALGAKARDQFIRALGRCFQPENLPQATPEGAATPTPGITVTGGVVIHGRPNEACGAWRLRYSLATQLDRLTLSSDPHSTGQEVLWPLVRLLLRDPVSAVRTETASKVGPVLGVLCGIYAPQPGLADEPLDLGSMDEEDSQDASARASGISAPGRSSDIGGNPGRPHLLRPTPEDGDPAPSSSGRPGGASSSSLPSASSTARKTRLSRTASLSKKATEAKAAKEKEKAAAAPKEPGFKRVRSIRDGPHHTVGPKVDTGLKRQASGNLAAVAAVHPPGLQRTRSSNASTAPAPGARSLEPWRPAGHKANAQGAAGAQAGSTVSPAAGVRPASGRPPLLKKASSKQAMSVSVAKSVSEKERDAVPLSPTILPLTSPGEGALQPVEEEREPRLWKCRSSESLPGLSPGASPHNTVRPNLLLASLTDGLPDVPGGAPTPPAQAPPPQRETAAQLALLAARGSFKSMTDMQAAAQAQGDTESSLNDSELIEALAAIRMTQSTDDSIRGQTGSPAPAPAVSIEQAMTFLTLMSKSSSHQERLLFVDIALGVARHLGARVAQSYVLPRLNELAADPVPNVRLALTHLLARPEWAAAMGGSAAVSNTLLEKLKNDADKDVQKEATEGLQASSVKAFSAPLARFLSTSVPDLPPPSPHGLMDGKHDSPSGASLGGNLGTPTNRDRLTSGGGQSKRKLLTPVA